jgi:CHAT domain-containing protein
VPGFVLIRVVRVVNGFLCPNVASLDLVDEQGNARRGFLRAHEIYGLKLPVEMVVLSACETGLGKEIRGEGLMGLTRAVFYERGVSRENFSPAGEQELFL